MATISKFYFHDAATTNTGTMPTGAFILSHDSTGDATNARTARLADNVISVTAQTSAAIASNANQLQQQWGLRRFVSAPLAAHTFAGTDGNWTFSAATAETSLNHNQDMTCGIYGWRPSTGLQVGSGGVTLALAEPVSASTQTAASVTNISGNLTIIDGDILVFEVYDNFTQNHSSSYTSTFYYDGTTEASTTDCASFVTPPAALTLFVAATVHNSAIHIADPAIV